MLMLYVFCDKPLYQLVSYVKLGLLIRELSEKWKLN
jgi:hypothetical protein